MDRQSVQNVARAMMRALSTVLCGFAVGALGGCGRTTKAPAVGAASNSKPASIQIAASDLAESARPAPSVRFVQTTPRPLPLNDAVTTGEVVHSQVVWAAYPPAQVADGDEAPRVRLAQARPLPLPAEGPDFVASHPSSSTAPDDQAAIVALPPVAAAPLNAGPLPRSPELDAVARQADAQTAHGFALAQRGAIYSARAEFIAALHTIAAALDSANRGNNHDQMLTAGLHALDEVDDFAAHGASAAGDADLARIVAGHQTPALKGVSLAGMSCTAAMSRYLTFAQEQLAGCTAGIPAGSGALYGLGKIYRVPDSMHGPVDPTHGAKAVALQQAALLVDSRNYRAANELGVLLANFGRLPEARAALLHSVAMSSQPTTWQNLSAVHQMMGERDLAGRAHLESVIAAARMNQNGRAASPSSYAVQWLDPATFAATTPLNIDGTPAARAGQPANMASASPTAATR